MRNRVTSNLRKAKKAYFQNIDPKNPKEFWKGLSKKQSLVTTLMKMVLRLSPVYKKLTIFSPDALIDYVLLWTTGRKVTLSSLMTYLPDDLLCDEDNVCKLLTNLDVSKSSGPERISAKMLKHAAVSIAPSITKLFNLSITSGRVPRGWKLSSVVPIPKSRKPQSHDNYRPISLLCILSKVLEKHIHNHIFKHLNQC